MENINSGERMLVSIVVVTYRRLDLLRRTLESLASCVWPDGFNEILVVENGPEEGVKLLLEDFKERLPMIYLHEPVQSSSAARNAGARAAQGDMIIFFDNDIRIDKHTLIAYRQAFDRFGQNCFYGGAVLPDYEKSPPAWLVPYLPSSAAGFEIGGIDRFLYEPSLLGANLAVPRHLLDFVRAFDPHGTTGDQVGTLGEETRLQKNLLAAGYAGVFVSSARVWHFVPEDRCSPEWVLKRSVRQGVTEATLAPEMGRLFGLPAWVFRSVMEKGFQLFIAKIFSKSLDKRFASEQAWAKLQGIIYGYRQRYRKNYNNSAEPRI